MDPNEPPEHYNSLAKILDTAWRSITRGANDRRNALHTPTFCTSSPTGPQARTLVLRGASEAERRLIFNADVRSGKVAELRADARAVVHFYDAGHKIQLRVSGSAQVHYQDEIAHAHWLKISASARRAYMVSEPGVAHAEPTSGLAEAYAHHSPELAATEPAYANYCVLHFTAHTIEWLFLHAQGQRRARFVWSETHSQWQGVWLSP